MPYRTNDDLPVSVRVHLPYHARDIYREAFNHAYAAHSGDVRREEAAHRIAWAAVKLDLPHMAASVCTLRTRREQTRAVATALWGTGEACL
jgi:cation transport regulator